MSYLSSCLHEDDIPKFKGSVNTWGAAAAGNKRGSVDVMGKASSRNASNLEGTLAL